MNTLILKTRYVLYILCMSDFLILSRYVGGLYGILSGIIVGYLLSSNDAALNTAGKRALFFSFLPVILAIGIGLYQTFFPNEDIIGLVLVGIITVVLIALAWLTQNGPRWYLVYGFLVLFSITFAGLFGVICALLYWRKDHHRAQRILFWSVLIPGLLFAYMLLIQMVIYLPNHLYQAAFLNGAVLILILSMLFLFGLVRRGKTKKRV